MSKQITIELPIIALKACAVFANKKTQTIKGGVNIANSLMIVTNAGKALFYQLKNADKVDLNIPTLNLKAFLSKLPKKTEKNTCQLSIISENTAQLYFSDDSASVIEIFELSVADVDIEHITSLLNAKKLDRLDDVMPLIDGRAITPFQKIGAIIAETGTKMTSGCRLIPTEKPELFHIKFGKPQATGIIYLYKEQEGD